MSLWKWDSGMGSRAHRRGELHEWRTKSIWWLAVLPWFRLTDSSSKGNLLASLPTAPARGVGGVG